MESREPARCTSLKGHPVAACLLAATDFARLKHRAVIVVGDAVVARDHEGPRTSDLSLRRSEPPLGVGSKRGGLARGFLRTRLSPRRRMASVGTVVVLSVRELSIVLANVVPNEGTVCTSEHLPCQEQDQEPHRQLPLSGFGGPQASKTHDEEPYAWEPTPSRRHWLPSAASMSHLNDREFIAPPTRRRPSPRRLLHLRKCAIACRQAEPGELRTPTAEPDPDGRTRRSRLSR